MMNILHPFDGKDREGVSCSLAPAATIWLEQEVKPHLAVHLADR